MGVWHNGREIGGIAREEQTGKYDDGVVNKQLPRQPVGPPVPEEVIEAKLVLIRIAMRLGNREMAMNQCKSAFDEVSMPEYTIKLRLSQLGLPMLTVNMLEKYGYLTIGDIIRRGIDSLENIPFLGKVRKAEIRAALSKAGFR